MANMNHAVQKEAMAHAPMNASLNATRDTISFLTFAKYALQAAIAHLAQQRPPNAPQENTVTKAH